MKKVEFVRAVYNLNELPKIVLPEIVLCGRSNVGKSSFINSLYNTKVAKTSSTPGKTRSINYYQVENLFYIVDLPGFGYAKVSKGERDAWQKLLLQYFALKRSTQMAMHLIDSRHEPMETDIELNGFLHKLDIPYMVILNKVDKLNQKELAQSKRRIREFFPELLPEENLFLYSAINGTGKKNILKLFNQLFNS
jgi:GTP-binding protein